LPEEWGLFETSMRFMEWTHPKVKKDSDETTAWDLCQTLVAETLLHEFPDRSVRADLVRDLFRRHPSSPLLSQPSPLYHVLVS
jgi:hypothetical protein